MTRKILKYATAVMLSLPLTMTAQSETESLPRVERDGLEFFMYEVNKDESLYGISKRFEWDIDEIIAYNPDAGGSLKKGFTLYYPTGRTVKKPSQQPSATAESVTVEKDLPELAEAEKANKILREDNDAYKVTGNQSEAGRQSAGEAQDEKSDVTSMTGVTTTQSVPTENSGTEALGAPEDGVKADREANAPTDSNRELRLALLIEDPASKRESEFTKGVLMALDARKTDGEKINLKILSAPASENDYETVVAELEEWQPELIFTTHEKNFPSYLLEYVNEGPTELVNVFDVKDDSFEKNPGVIQMMTPSVSFSKDVADFAASRFRDRDLIVIGTSDSADEVGSLMVEQWPGRTVDNVTPEMLTDMEFDENRSYLLYVNVTTKNDINRLLTLIGEKKLQYPLAEISVFGRANWIVYADALSDKFFDADVYFPSRFYFESDSRRGKDFRSKFTELYSHNPVKSFPMFSVAGYDEANYFIDALRKNGGNWNRTTIGGTTPLQAEIRLQPVEGGGFVNPICYVVRFAPFKMIDKMPLK